MINCIMPNLAILKPLIAKAPLLLKKTGKAIDAFGNGDGIFEFGDIVDTVKEAAASVIEIVTDWF